MAAIINKTDDVTWFSSLVALLANHEGYPRHSQSESFAMEVKTVFDVKGDQAEFWKLLKPFENVWKPLKTWENYGKTFAEPFVQPFAKIWKSFENFWNLLKTFENLRKLEKTMVKPLPTWSHQTRQMVLSNPIFVADKRSQRSTNTFFSFFRNLRRRAGNRFL